MAKPAFGSLGDSFSVVSLKAYLAEFISTVLFVFAGVGSSMAYSKLTGGAALDPAGLVAVAVCHGFALFVTVSIAARISGGHVNPAVSFGLSLAGQMTVLTSILYTITQLAASVVACILLKVATGGGEAIPIHTLGAGIGIFQAILMEAITTFGLVYTIMATAVDPKRGSLGTIGPIAIGLIVAANIFATGPFTGGSMNPARSFGPGVVSGDMTNNWIYLAGPMIGGGIAGVLYNLVFMHSDQYELAGDF